MKRVIACLDVRDGRVVKGVRFSGLRDAGDPAELAARYESEGVDELTVLDISATTEGRGAAAETVKRVRRVLSVPLTVGGGVKTAEDVARLLDAGADKVSINSAAVDRAQLISECADRFGTQCVVLAIDARAGQVGWEVLVRSGSTATGRDAVAWAQEAERLGAGEVLLTSWDRDGTRSGYDLLLTRAIADAVRIPVIASGGASGPKDMLEVLRVGAEAVLAASIFHNGDFTIGQVKAFLREFGMEVRR